MLVNGFLNYDYILDIHVITLNIYFIKKNQIKKAETFNVKVIDNSMSHFKEITTLSENKDKKSFFFN